MSNARFVDSARSDLLGRMGIETIGDLLQHFPFRYLDLSKPYDLLRVPVGAEATVVGRVHDIKVKKPRPRLSIVEVIIVDGVGQLMGVWFNQAYMAEKFRIGQRVAFAGTVEFNFGFKQMKAPYVEHLEGEDQADEVGRIIPVHRGTEGLTKNWLRRLIAAALEDYGDVPDHLPVDLRLRHDLVSKTAALRDVHFPRSMAAVEAARRRLAFDELLLLQIGVLSRRRKDVEAVRGVPHVVDGERLKALQHAVPFEPTSDQERAISDVLHDLSLQHPMNRMLLGDVGTGKTLVAAHALAAAADSGFQAAMMAPTEVLATQYSTSVGPWLDAAGVSWALLTGSTSKAERDNIQMRCSSGELDVLFGTHALLESSLEFSSLGLAIVDEQHRFGVRQRLTLRSKGAGVDLLVMSATPIPRSLALTLYGDLDVSYLREQPSGSRGSRVTTKLLNKSHRDEAYESIHAAVARGEQAYVVCALVEESDSAQAKAANTEAIRLAEEVFPQHRVGVLTGRMRADEKSDVMNRFRQGDIDVLVSTTVIEVGVDVPNATVMLVEDAERFGLAQLHQLRGRVGRGEAPAWFYLFADPKTPDGRDRMKAIVENDDGFALAERDLELRGEGSILGDRQHGLPELRVASIVRDGDLISETRECAMTLLESDPELSAVVHAPMAFEASARFQAAAKWVRSG